ncbi:MAG TPA: aminotransferase class I/II-fold pyridoxal phosphate-dependent enzyme, partial [Bryobacteraceae bacterium]
MPTITGQASRKTFLPYCLPLIGEEEIAEVVDTLRSGWLTTGPKVKRFEQEFATYIGAKHAIAVNSCTSALHISLAALDIGRDDEVIVPTLTFCATANVVAHLGATPVIVDVDENSQISLSAIEQAITPRTRAIVPVHYAGQACDLDAILDLGRRHGLPVVEDAAHAAGTEYRGRKVGTHGTAVCFSFYAIKNMTTGEGGMITT